MVIVGREGGVMGVLFNGILFGSLRWGHLIMVRIPRFARLFIVIRAFEGVVMVAVLQSTWTPPWLALMLSPGCSACSLILCHHTCWGVKAG